jgi:hypothetical protein
MKPVINHGHLGEDKLWRSSFTEPTVMSGDLWMKIEHSARCKVKKVKRDTKSKVMSFF